MWAYFGSELYEPGLRYAESVARELADAELSRMLEDLRQMR